MDIKGMYQDRAKELAHERHGAEFYSLPEAQQQEVYNEAMLDVSDRLAAQAEALIDRTR